MCKARDWQQVRTAACLFCFLLCVLLNVHLHSASAAEASSTGDTNVRRTSQSRRHLNLIMLEYGDANKSVSLHGLQRLMKQIGLLNNASAAHAAEEHEHEHGEEEEVRRGHQKVIGANGTAADECPTASQMLAWYPTSLEKKSLTEADFLDLCPTLVYLLHTKACSRGAGGIGSEAADGHAKPSSGRTWKVWGASLLAVLATSLGGMATIFLIRPLMRTRFYTLVVQFLIALAVGSLSGDAFLHLLPHALFPEDDHKHEHKEADGKQDHMGTLYRCLTALIGIYCFFVIERVTVLCQNRRSRRRNSARRPQSNSSNVGEKLCNPFHRSYANLTGGTQPESVICEAAAAAAAEAAEAAADELKVEFLHDCDRCSAINANANANNAESDTNGNTAAGSHFRRSSAARGSPADDKQQQRNNHRSEDPTTKESDELTGPSSPLSTTAATAATDSADAAAASAVVASGHPAGVTFEDDVNGDDAEDSERGGGRGHQHHHHGHSHSHTTVRALAWTVIIGDGLHNFCDGMALGAAFAADVGSGVSTAVAVFCHELPHELGDFAVLLQAGMSVRMALLANLVSSLVCLLGMICGVLLAKGATNWVFMVTAGMFLYIALVDMMPELTTEKSSRGPGPCIVFFWQNVGFFIGAGIMLVISLFEHKIIKFGSS